MEQRAGIHLYELLVWLEAQYGHRGDVPVRMLAPSGVVVPLKDARYDDEQGGIVLAVERLLHSERSSFNAD